MGGIPGGLNMGVSNKEIKVGAPLALIGGCSLLGLGGRRSSPRAYPRPPVPCQFDHKLLSSVIPLTTKYKLFVTDPQ